MNEKHGRVVPMVRAKTEAYERGAADMRGRCIAVLECSAKAWREQAKACEQSGTSTPYKINEAILLESFAQAFRALPLREGE